MPSSPCTNQRGTTFSLRVTLGYGADNKTGEKLNKACSQQTFGLSDMASSFFSNTFSGDSWNSCDNQEKFFVASASHVQLSVNPSEKFWKTNANLITVFMPPHMIASALEKHFSSNQIALGSSFWIYPPSSSNFVKDLLPKIHPSALTGCRILGIILTSFSEGNGPAELLVLEVPKGRSIQDDILRITNGCTIAKDPHMGILKILPLGTINFTHEYDDNYNAKYLGKRTGKPNHGDSKFREVTSTAISSTTTIISPEIPACPVCLHRIDPIRLGLPGPCVHQLCSKFCPSPSLMIRSWEAEEEICHKQRLLKKWAIPARCKACQVIEHYWNHSNSKYGEHEDCGLFCEECSMHKTLWTCLTCGFVGCGRYSNKHSVAHFEQTKHPYSLELATLRIWDYCHGEYGGFVQRPDLLECPSSPPLLYPWLTRGLDSDGYNESVSTLGQPTSNALNDSAFGNNINSTFSEVTEKPSKKVIMIGEEYEALLQSALEDQAQHYKDEINRLRAKHTDSLVDRANIIPEEGQKIEELRLEIRLTRESIENASKELIDAQAQDVELRSISARLFSEQKEANELLKKIQEEHQRDNEEGKLQIEDLEQQIADLSGNLRMRQQFYQNDELVNAQIYGTTTVPESRSSGGRRGKKKGRFFRK